MIRVHDVSQEFMVGNSLHMALSDISFSAAPKDIVAIMGPSGSGKSTLLNIIGGILTPTRGYVTINDVNISTLTDNEVSALRSKLIGFVFQSFNLIPVFTAYENVEYPLLLQNVPPKERNERVLDILSRVGLEKFVKSLPSHMSGGQQQRVAVARALIAKPKVLLGDEPTANLDERTANEVLDLMLKLNQEIGASLIFSTHDKRVANVASRVCELHSGVMAA